MTRTHGVATAAVIWRNGRDRYLLHVLHPRYGWLLPGGHMEPGEQPLQAAIREAQEEVGLTLPPMSTPEWELGERPLIELYMAQPEPPRLPEVHRHVDHRYAWASAGPRPTVTLGEDVQGVMWCPLHACNHLRWEMLDWVIKGVV